ncbi:MAG: hypothetical protein OEZ28_04305, partial [Nitrospinota bacterium]|nr:hypothetical protein [Nitrospinota bacterium]
MKQSTFLIPLFLFLAIGAFAPYEASSATITADPTALDEQSGTDAKCSLREAVQAINQGADSTPTLTDCVAVVTDAYGTNDTIILPAGTYTLTGAVVEDGNASGDLDISKAVTIQGAGAVSTIIDGNSGATTDRVFHVTVAVALTVDGVTITGGYAVGASCPTGCGGGIFSNGAVTVTNSTISGNKARNFGGIWANGAVFVTNSTISNNSAGADIGGIYSNGTLTVTNSTISGNSAGVSYGGILSMGSTTVTNSTVSGNSAGADNGGIYSNGALTVTNSTISGNSAGISFGGIVSFSSVMVTNSTISGNTAGGGGGGIYSFSSVTVTNSTISGNSAGASYGGIYSLGGGSISNSTISGNRAVTGRGGGITNSNLPLSIVNSTIYGNSAPVSGAGLMSWSGTLTLTNTIVAANTGGGGDCAINVGFGLISSSGYNVDSDGTCGLANTGDISNSATITGSLGAL